MTAWSSEPPDRRTEQKGYPLYGNDVHERWVGTRARLRGRHSGSEVVSNGTVSEGHTVGKMLAVAYAESFHAGPGIRLILAVKGRPRVTTATMTRPSTRRTCGSGPSYLALKKPS
jgi:hypothetical protein